MMVDTPSRSTRPRRGTPTTGPASWARDLLRDNIVTTVLAMVLLIPLLTGTDLLNTRGKLAAFEGLGTVLLLLVLSQARLRGAGGRLRAALTVGPNLPLVLLVAFGVVSWAISPFRAFASMDLMRLGFGVLIYFVLVCHLRGKAHLQTMTDGLLVATAAAALYGLAQMSTSDAMVEGSFGSHELLGSFLMLMLPVALALGLTERGDPKRQLAAQAVALLAAACLMMARTRSAWLGAVVSLATLSFLAWRYQQVPSSVQAGTAHFFRQVQQRKHLIIGPALILVGALTLLILLSQTGGTLGQRLGTLASVGEDRSFQARQAFWRGSLHMAEARPLFGWGIGSYPVLEERFTGLGDFPARVLSHGTSHSNLAHNYYLQTAAETGLVGLGLYLAAVALFFVTGVRALWTVESGLRKAVLLGCLAAMAGQVVDAFGSPAYNFASVSLFQWVLMGLGMFAAGLVPRSLFGEAARTGGADSSPGVSAPLLRGLQYGFAGLVALGVVAQIIPTMPAALAETCTVPTIGTFRTQTSGPNAIGVGQSTNVVSTFNGRPAHGVRYTETYSPSPAVAMSLVTITPQTDYSFMITRNDTPAPPNGAQITIRAVYFDDTGRPYQNLSVTVILN